MKENKKVLDILSRAFFLCTKRTTNQNITYLLVLLSIPIYSTFIPLLIYNPLIACGDKKYYGKY